jgi:hypothetical protein
VIGISSNGGTNTFPQFRLLRIAYFGIAYFGIAYFGIAFFGTKESNCFLCGRLGYFEYIFILIKLIAITNGSRAMFHVLGEILLVTSADESRRQIVVCPPVYAAGLLS